MTATTAAARERHLLKLSKEIAPTAAQLEGAERSQHHLREVLQTGQVKRRVIRDFLTGSYARGTALAPLDDVDIVFVVDPAHWTASDGELPDPAKVLKTFRDAIAARYSESKARTQRRSVGLVLHHLRIDVVPALEVANDSNFILVPDPENETWIRSAPLLHGRHTARIDKESSGRFTALVRLLKHWNGELPENTQMKSFAMETLAGTVFRRVALSSIEAGMATIWDLLAHLGGEDTVGDWEDAFGIKTHWWSGDLVLPDVAGTGSDVGGSVDAERLGRLAAKARIARDRVTQAASARNQDSAQQHLELSMGYR